jgi:hypothetical protein
MAKTTKSIKKGVSKSYDKGQSTARKKAGTRAGKRASDKTSTAVRKEYKKAIKKGKPLTQSQQRLRKADVSSASNERIQKRETVRQVSSAGTKNPSEGRRKKVTLDARKEAVGKASGVQVNNKQVRKGRVKAAESVVKKAKVAKVARAAVKGGRAGILGSLVATAYELGEDSRKKSKSKGVKGRNVAPKKKVAKKKSSKWYK